MFSIAHTSWVGLALAASAFAAPERGGEINVPIALRVRSFMTPAPAPAPAPAASGATVILYLPGNAASEGEALRIERGLSAASVRSRRVPVTSTGSLGGTQLAFVTGGMRAYYGEIAAVSRQRILTVTADFGCVSAGHCAVGINAVAGAPIVVSRAACRAGNIRFGSAFLMLVKEI